MLYIGADRMAGGDGGDMRVLIWAESNPGTTGGAGSWINDLAAALRLLGYQVAWLYSDQIQQAVDTFKPDIVTIGTIHNFIGLQHADWLADQRIPGVWMLHDYWPFCGPRMLMQERNRSDRSCEAVAGVCQNSCGGRHDIPATLGRFYTVTGCEGAAEIMRRNGMRVDAVVEEGIDTDLFRPDFSRRDSTNVIYASTAWNLPWKGMHILSRAIQGTGLGLRLLTDMPRAQLAPELQRASIYVFPSAYQEIWGLALTEAMASGCACIASDVAGARAQIESYMTGVLVPPGDIAALREVVKWLATDVDSRAAFGRLAREHVAEDHSLIATAKRWERVYAEAVTPVMEMAR